MKRRDNPFVIQWGQEPFCKVERTEETYRIVDTFRAERPSTRTYVITGVRGSGKTVLLTSVANELKEDGWLIINLNSESNMLQSFAAQMYDVPEVRPHFIKAKLDLSVLGIGLEIKGSEPVSDIETAARRMLAITSRLGKRVLITIDEVANDAKLREFTQAYQIFMREGYDVFLLMTGLYNNINALMNSRKNTFLSRTPRIVLGPLNCVMVAEKYKEIFKCSGKTAKDLAGLTKGYSYAFQVLGYLLWDYDDMDIDAVLPEYDRYMDAYAYSIIWSELAEKEKDLLRTMALNKTDDVKSVREYMNMASNEMSVYRNRLMLKGVLTSFGYGNLSFALPRFDVFVRESYD